MNFDDTMDDFQESSYKFRFPKKDSTQRPVSKIGRGRLRKSNLSQSVKSSASFSKSSSRIPSSKSQSNKSSSKNNLETYLVSPMTSLPLKLMEDAPKSPCGTSSKVVSQSTSGKSLNSESQAEESDDDIIEIIPQNTIESTENKKPEDAIFSDEDVDNNLEDSLSAQQLTQLEKSVCSEAERICPSCKHIVLIHQFTDHLMSCLKKFEYGNKRNTETEVKCVPCPFCQKMLSGRVRTRHIKSCGKSHGLSVDEISCVCKSLEIPEGKTTSRLPTEKGTTKKGEIKRKKGSKKGSDMDIARALSISMRDEERRLREIKEDQLLDLGAVQIVQEDRRQAPLPPSSSTSPVQWWKMPPKPKKKGSRGRRITPLVTRTSEERQRIITERLASLFIMGSSQSSQGSATFQHLKARPPTSPLLPLYNEESNLWLMAGSSLERTLEDYFVPALAPHVQQSKGEVGGLLKNMSQLPGRENYTLLEAENCSDTESQEMEVEKTVVDKYCTQLILAEMLGSQEALELSVGSLNMTDASLFGNLNECRENAPVDNVDGDALTDDKDEGNGDNEVFSDLGATERLDAVDQMQLNIGEEKEDINGIDRLQSNNSDDENESNQNLEQGNGNYGHNSLENVQELHIQAEANNSSNVEAANVKSPLSCEVNEREPFKCDIEDVNDDIIVLDEVQNNKKSMYFKSRSSETCIDSSKKESLKNVFRVPNQSIKSSFRDSISVTPQSPKQEGNEPLNNLSPNILSQSKKERSNSSIKPFSTVCPNSASFDTIKALINDSMTHTSPSSIEIKSQDGHNPSKVLDNSNDNDRFAIDTVQLLEESDNIAHLEKSSKSTENENTACSDASNRLTSMQSKLVLDWGNLLQSRKFSDVIIIVKSEEILVHLLVLNVRCPDLVSEISYLEPPKVIELENCDDVVKIEKKIDWSHLNYSLAYDFIDYIYTGRCHVQSKTDEKWLDMYDLALKYNCSELISHLECLYNISVLTKNTLNTVKEDTVEKSSEIKAFSSVTSKDILKNKDGNTFKDNECTKTKELAERKVSSPYEDEIPVNDVSSPPKIIEVRSQRQQQSPDIFDSWVESPCLEKSIKKIERNPSFERELSKWVDDGYDLNLNDSDKNSDKRDSINSKKCLIFDSPKEYSYINDDNVSLLCSPERNEKRMLCSPERDKSTKMLCSPERDGSTRMLCSPERDESRRMLCSPDRDENRMLYSPERDKSRRMSNSSESVSNNSKSGSNVAHFRKENTSKVALQSDVNVVDLALSSDSDSESSFYVPLLDRINANAPNIKSPNKKNVAKSPIQPIDKILKSNNTCSKSQIQCESEYISTNSNVETKSSKRKALCVLPPENAKKQKILNSLTQKPKEIYKEREYLSQQVDPERRVLDPNSNWNMQSLKKPDLISKYPSGRTVSKPASPSKKSAKLWKTKSADYGTVKTPITDRIHLRGNESVDITPLPDYKAMRTPELLSELNKFGIRKLSRRKAVTILLDIYERTHPFVSQDECRTPKAAPKPPLKAAIRHHSNVEVNVRGPLGSGSSPSHCDESSVDLNSSQESNRSSEFDCLEESINPFYQDDAMGFDDVEDVISSTQQVSLESKLTHFIQSDQDLYQRILFYEPLWTTDIMQKLKQADIKCSMARLIQFLDEKGITFRLPARERNNRRKKKKTSPKKRSPKK